MPPHDPPLLAATGLARDVRVSGSARSSVLERMAVSTIALRSSRRKSGSDHVTNDGAQLQNASKNEIVLAEDERVRGVVAFNR